MSDASLAAVNASVKQSEQQCSERTAGERARSVVMC